jgi:hypothetical protein
MAYSAFAEHNRAAWVGVRPGVYGEQIIRSAATILAEIVVLYTVPALSTFLLFGTALHVHCGVAATVGSLFVTNAADVTQYTIAYDSFSNAGDDGSTVRDRYIPLEIPAGFKVKVQQTVAGSSTFAEIEGLLAASSELD